LPRAGLAPARVRCTGLAATLPATARDVVLVLISLTVGAATHTRWDAFTHAGGWGPPHHRGSRPPPAARNRHARAGRRSSRGARTPCRAMSARLPALAVADQGG